MVRQGTLAYRAMALPGLALLRSAEFIISRVDGDASFYDPARFAWTRPLEAEWRTIRREFERLPGALVPAAQEVSEEQARITTGRQWKTYVFYAFGRRADDNCARCPETTRLLEAIPGLTSALFSVLEPHAHIRHHRGVFKGVLRHHLALVVPQPPALCGIRVGSETRHWAEGASLVFDDTHDHEAWNNADDVRVVLIVDVLRRLPPPLHAVNRGLCDLIGRSPFIQNAMDRIAEWNRRVADVPYVR